MRQRRIGSTDLVASEVGLAGVVAGRRAGGAVRRGRRRPARGRPRPWIAYFAATDSDDDGRAEELLGQAVRGHRDEVTVATTFGYDTTPRPWEPDPTAPRHDWSAGFAGRALDRSLLRLRLEPVDLWLLHHPGMDAIESDELFEFLEAQVAKGKIRAYGVALGPGPGWGDEGAAALGERRVAAVETVYNVAEQSPGRDLAALATETGAGLVARDPLAPGCPRPPGPASSSWSGTATRPSTRPCSAWPWPTAVATALPEVRGPRTWPSWPARPTCPAHAEDLDRLAELREAGGLTDRAGPSAARRCSSGRAGSSPAGSTRRCGPSGRSGGRRGSSPGAGAYLEDVDGNRYVDLVCSWGPLIAGHAHPGWWRRCRRPRPAGPASAPPPRPRSSWPRRWAGGSRRWRSCAWSAPAPRPP